MLFGIKAMNESGVFLMTSGTTLPSIFHSFNSGA